MSGGTLMIKDFLFLFNLIYKSVLHSKFVTMRVEKIQQQKSMARKKYKYILNIFIYIKVITRQIIY